MRMRGERVWVRGKRFTYQPYGFLHRGIEWRVQRIERVWGSVSVPGSALSGTSVCAVRTARASTCGMISGSMPGLWGCHAAWSALGGCGEEDDDGVLPDLVR